MPAPGPGQQANENQPGQATGDRMTANGQGATDTGHLTRGGGAGQYIGLPPRDRAALQQSHAEKYPQAYGPMVEQYLKNLSEDDDSK
jgi:hypothetical protein